MKIFFLEKWFLLWASYHTIFYENLVFREKKNKKKKQNKKQMYLFSQSFLLNINPP